MDYITEKQLNLYEELDDFIYEQSGCIIDSLAKSSPKVLHFGKRSKAIDFEVTSKFVAIEYYDEYSDCPDVDHLCIPLNIFAKGTSDSVQYAINEYQKAQSEKKDEPKVDSSPFFTYVKSLESGTDKWRYAFILADRYNREGKDPNNFAEEIKAKVEKEYKD